MGRQIERSSSTRKWWLLIGGIVVLIVAFDYLERLVRKEPLPSSVSDVDARTSPAPPQLRRLDDGAIEIRHDIFQRTTIRMDDEDAAEALFECLSQGINVTFGNGTEGLDRGHIRSETQRILKECGGMPEVPMPLRPSPPAQ
jgi:hypothetical protein